jgi:hypothetical protein
MKSENLFSTHHGGARGESANSNNGSQHRGIEVPKVVKGIHVEGAPDAPQIIKS